MEKELRNVTQNYRQNELFEYLLIIAPGKIVFDKIMNEKKTFSENYKIREVSKALPHITVANFIGRDNMEETVIRWMQRIGGDQKSFTVTLNNYSGFPSHTIFLCIQDPAPFNELATKLKTINSYIKGNNCPSARFITHPHVSIARSLPAHIYERAIRDYSTKSFNESFNVTELVLLRRQHQYDQCKKVAVFSLQPTEWNNN